MPSDWIPLWLSLRVAGMATAISLMLALWLAYLLASREFRGKEAVEAAVAFPLALPPTILGGYFLFWFTRRGFTWQIAAGAGVAYALPVLARAARSAFQANGADYENAARSLGASEWRVFWRVALPLAWRPILAAAAMTFARLLAEFAATLLIAIRLGGTRQAPASFIPGIAIMTLAAVYMAIRLERAGPVPGLAGRARA